MQFTWDSNEPEIMAVKGRRALTHLDSAQGAATCIETKRDLDPSFGPVLVEIGNAEKHMLGITLLRSAADCHAELMNLRQRVTFIGGQKESALARRIAIRRWMDLSITEDGNPMSALRSVWDIDQSEPLPDRTCQALRSFGNQVEQAECDSAAARESAQEATHQCELFDALVERLHRSVQSIVVTEDSAALSKRLEIQACMADTGKLLLLLAELGVVGSQRGHIEHVAGVASSCAELAERVETLTANLENLNTRVNEQLASCRERRTKAVAAFEAAVVAERRAKLGNRLLIGWFIVTPMVVVLMCAGQVGWCSGIGVWLVVSLVWAAIAGSLLPDKKKDAKNA